MILKIHKNSYYKGVFTMPKKVISIIGTYRKGKTIDNLVERAIEGLKSKSENISVEKLYLADYNIQYCKNCMICRNDSTSTDYAKCVITDDMQKIYPKIFEADSFIFATPINMGTVTAVMKTFLERCCWVFAKPGNKPLKGCPRPRTRIKKNAIIILSTGLVPPIFRKLCDDATTLIKSFCKSMLNVKVNGTLYAGAVEKRKENYYNKKAFKLGMKLL